MDYLKHFSQQDRSISLPESRLVLNPFDFEAVAPSVTQEEYSGRSSLPLNIGYCCPHIHNRRGIEWANALTVYETNPEKSSAPTLVWQSDFSKSEDWTMPADPSTCTLKKNRAAIGVPRGEGRPPFQFITSKEISIDPQKTILEVTVDSVSEMCFFAVKINNGDAASVVLMLGRTSGVYSFQINQYIFQKEFQTIRIELFGVSYHSETAVFSDIRLWEVSPIMCPALAYQNKWEPSAVTCHAEYPGGSTADICDFFYDEQTIVRKMSLTAKHDFIIAGDLPGSCRMEDGALVFSLGHTNIRIRKPNGAGGFSFYESLPLLLGGNAGRPIPTHNHRFWMFRIPACDSAIDTDISVEFNYKNSVPLKRPVTEALSNRQTEWEAWLKEVPRPPSFALKSVDAKGVTPEQIEQIYYSAWTQIIANILPPGEEVDFPYSSMTVGKASLWAYGDKACSYASSWDSLHGIMLYGMLNPSAAWDMFFGFMSLVSESGQIGGESLPSVKARTAWTLFRLMPDQNRLNEVFPALEKYLTWRIENPRWIYLDRTPRQDDCDMDFVSAALLDIDYLMKICAQLSLEERRQHWDDEYWKLYDKMVLWFFDGENIPCQHYYRESGQRESGSALWILKAMHLPRLRDKESDALKRLFFSIYNPQKAFGNFPEGVKAEEMSYLIYGLMDNGLADQAQVLAELSVRDIVRASFLSEAYNTDRDTGLPFPDGVRPSAFGCSQLIDSVFLMNGIRID